MPIGNESTTLLHNGWIIKFHPPTRVPINRIILLLHGFSGDENSMDIFTRSLPGDAWLFSPRAPYPTSTTGFSWSSLPVESPKTAEALVEQAHLLWLQIPEWQKLMKLEGDYSLSIVGFSQGGAMALVLSLLYPSEVKKTACLSGFLPDGIETLLPYNSLEGQEFLFAHGTEDKIIPADLARQAAHTLQARGGQVTFCENRVGHKVAASCLHALAEFFH